MIDHFVIKTALFYLWGVIENGRTKACGQHPVPEIARLNVWRATESIISKRARRASKEGL